MQIMAVRLCNRMTEDHTSVDYKSPVRCLDSKQFSHEGCLVNLHCSTSCKVAYNAVVSFVTSDFTSKVLAAATIIFQLVQLGILWLVKETEPISPLAFGQVQSCRLSIDIINEHLGRGNCEQIDGRGWKCSASCDCLLSVPYCKTPHAT